MQYPNATIHIGFHSNHYYAITHSTYPILPCPISNNPSIPTSSHYDSDNDNTISNDTSFTLDLPLPPRDDSLCELPDPALPSLKKRRTSIDTVGIDNTVEIDNIAGPSKKQKSIKDFFTPTPTTRLPYSYKKPKDRPG
jgi:hypothetical protein